MTEPCGDGDDGGSRREMRRARDAVPDPYEDESNADERELNPPEEEPDTRPDPYATVADHARELERRVTVPAGPSNARTPPMANSTNTPTRKRRRADDPITRPRLGDGGFRVEQYISHYSKIRLDTHRFVEPHILLL